MARKSDIWFSRSRRGYFTYIAGQRHRLKTCEEDDKPAGPNYNAAIEQFKRLAMGGDRTTILDQTVRAAVARWCEHLEAGAPRTHKVARSTLASFVKELGHVNVSQLSGLLIHRWIDGRREWSETTRATAFQRLKTCFRWNARMGCVAKDPLESIPVPAQYRAGGRGPDFLLEPELINLMLNTSNAAWADFVRALWRTGARPGEIANVERRHYVAADHILYIRADDPYYKHKTARTKKHGDINRTIHLHPEVEEIVRRNASRGKILFPTSHGKRFTTPNVYRCWHLMLRTKPICEWMESHDRTAEHTIPYSFRHTWITNAILRGTNIKLVADMCGTSAAKIEKHYSHATADRSAMRDAYLRSI